MARLSDVPRAFRAVGFINFAKRVGSEVDEDLVFTWASALAYSWIFAVFPFLVALLTLVPYLPAATRAKAMSDISDAVYTSVGGDAGRALVDNVAEVVTKTQGGLLSLGLLLAIWSASGGMNMTLAALDRCYEVKKPRKFIRQRLVSLALTLAGGFSVLVVLVLLPIGGMISKYVQNRAIIGPAAVVILDISRYVAAIALLFGVVAMLYHFGPNVRRKWQSVTPGAVFAVGVWLAMGFGFSFYVSRYGNFNKTYGTLGAAIILLLFFYLSATVLLIGAEINSVIDAILLGVQPVAGDPISAKPAPPEAKPAPRPPVVATTPIEAPAGWWKWAALALVGGLFLPKLPPRPRNAQRERI